MIVYFSATGNTEYIAKLLADKLNDKIVNMTDILKQGAFMKLTSQKPYVFLSPIYLSSFPIPVMNLLKNSIFEGNKNFYFIATCAGKSESSGAAAFCKEFTELKNATFKGTTHIGMPQDYLMFFKIKSEEENKERFTKAINRAEQLATIIQNNDTFETKEVSKFHHALVGPTVKYYNQLFINTKKFYTTDSCISCGLCEKVCPMNNITLTDGKPVWNNNCIHCTACINKCPKQAIEYGKKTIGKPRYQAPKYH